MQGVDHGKCIHSVSLVEPIKILVHMGLWIPPYLGDIIKKVLRGANMDSQIPARKMQFWLSHCPVCRRKMRIVTIMLSLAEPLAVSANEMADRDRHTMHSTWVPQAVKGTGRYRASHLHGQPTKDMKNIPKTLLVWQSMIQISQGLG